VNIGANAWAASSEFDETVIRVATFKIAVRAQVTFAPFDPQTRFNRRERRHLVCRVLPLSFAWTVRA
jgi:hypothetical protein